MEVEEIQVQARKRWRIGNGRDDRKVEDDDDDGECGGPEGDGERAGGDKGRLLPWQSSRIFRVSRTSGGKDRHSKVLTAKGLRDRRVRLSVSTAIQFYDLQDRLGYDQPSKAVEWLIKAAADAIAELPPLDGAFPPTPKQDSDEKRFEPELGKQHQMQQQQQQQQQQLLSLTKSACSSTSETSKGSSRSENRIKARERARERTAKEREKEKETCSSFPQQHHPNPNSQSSFTELLTGAHNNNSSSSNGDDATIAAAAAAAQQNTNPNFLHKQLRHFPPSMDYFNSAAAIFGPTAMKSGFSSQTQFSSPPLGSVPLGVTAAGSDHHPELQQFAFLQDHLVPVPAATAPNDYNLNFAISSSFAGYNRGTLQSNSSSPLLPHLQRFSSPVVTDGPPPNMPFFIGTAAAASTAAGGAENQFPAGFDGRLQLCYSDGRRHSDLKGKGKS